MSRGRITVDHQQQHRHSPSSSSVDNSVAFETTYVIPSNDNESNSNKKVRFIVQRQPPANISVTTTTTKPNEMTQHHQQQQQQQQPAKTLSFVDAVNNKNLDLSTGLFSSSPSSLILSSTFSSSPSSSDQHRHPHTHFSSSFSPPHTSITTGDNKIFSTTSSSSVNNRTPLPVGADSTATITLKEAIDSNILDAHSAYVVDTLEQR